MMNIDFKKYGLKEIKFSELADGDEFNILNDFDSQRMNPPEFYRRKLVGENVIYVDGMRMMLPETTADFTKNEMVFVEA